MNTIVIYQSSTGFTKKYAEWIGHALDAEVKDIKKLGNLQVSDYDRVVFGGWLMGGMISGLDKIKAMNPKNLVVFGTGASQHTQELMKQIKETNHLGEIPYFYMPGGLHFSQLNFLKKMMLKMVKKSIAKKEAKTEQDLYMEKVLGTDFDSAKEEYIAPLVQLCKQG